MSTSPEGTPAVPPAARHADHPDDPIVIAPPDKLLIPIISSEGLLRSGASVRRGQRLFPSDASLARVPLSPLDGIIGEIREVELIGGGHSQAVEIRASVSSPASSSDRADETLNHPASVESTARVDSSHAAVDALTAHANDADAPVAGDSSPAAHDLAAFIEQLRRRGLTANRRTCPDLLAQLYRAMQRPIDTILCSLLDAPGGPSPLNAAALNARRGELIAGVSALARVSGAHKTWLIAAPELARRAAASIRREQAARSIRIIDIVNAYPQADPVLLIFTLLGRRLRPGTLPPDAGCILIDGPAAVAIGQCVGDHDIETASAAPPGHLETLFQLRDSSRGASRTFIVPIGTPLRHIFDVASIGNIDGQVIGAGAALSNVRVGSLDAVVAGYELIVDIAPAPPAINPDPCIRCGWCVEACPVRIHPARLLEAAQENDSAAAARFGIEACIECGICSYVCPARLPLLGGIRELRKGKI